MRNTLRTLQSGTRRKSLLAESMGKCFAKKPRFVAGVSPTMQAMNSCETLTPLRRVLGLIAPVEASQVPPVGQRRPVEPPRQPEGHAGQDVARVMDAEDRPA